MTTDGYRSFGSLVFVHLSDLHFREPGSPLAYREVGLRDRLLDDISRAVALTESKQVEAIVLTGDIARSGQQVEYREARAWLDRLCSDLSISPTRALTCPGNHDVDWTRLGEERLESNAELRTCPKHLIDSKIDTLLAEPDQAVLWPLQNYNEFAAGTACSIDQFLAWGLPPMSLGGCYSLAIRGATSVVNSDRNDGAGTMAVQTNQLRVNQVPGRVNLLMIHHSPYFWAKPHPTPAGYGHHVVLYGHTHEPYHQTINGTCLELTAGAVHPEEGEEFAIPSYNVIEISIEEPVDASDARVFARVRVYHREFLKVQDCFRDSGPTPDIDERVRVPRCSATDSDARDGREQVAETTHSEGEAAVADYRAPLETETGEPDPSRLIRLAFERLGAGNRVRVLDRMGLLTDDLVGLQPHKLIRAVAERVTDAGLVDEFLSAISQFQ